APMLGEAKQTPLTWEVFTVKYFPQQTGGIWYEAVPTMLYPYADRELAAGWNTQYWITVKVPPGTAAGVYKGAISVEPQNGARAEIPFNVTVRPFDLPATSTECGMWNNTALQSHMLTAFPDNEAYTTKVLDAECRDMVEHGLNGYGLGGVTASKVDPKTHSATIDFSKLDLLFAATQRAGMHGRHMLDVQGFATYGLMHHGFTEFSPEFNEAYVSGLTQVRDWIVKNKVPVVVQLTDEPRETELNEWNRNLKDTIKYCKLARKVENLPTMVTVMGDKGAFGRPYAPIVPMVDVLSTHSWPKSDDIIYLATEGQMADYWAYNNGFNRFAHGFYLWKIHALGHWQWVYSWEICDAHIPVFFARDTSAVYAFPGGFLDTIKYEDIREGIDDHRYLELLNASLKSAAADNPAKAPAEEFLKTLEKFLPQYPHDTGLETGAEAGGVYSESKQNRYFGAWREQIAEYVAALQAKRAPAKVEEAWAMFPQQMKEEDRAVVCALIDKAHAPVIDGKGDDAAWKDAKEVGDFVDLAKGRLAVVQTKVKTICDGEKIYFLFTCVEAKYGELKGYAINRDEDTWEDDSVEVFLDTAFDRKTYKHISVNCLGTVQDEDTRDILWNAATQAAVQKSKGAWTVELSVSLKDLGGKMPDDGVTWGVNLCRNRQPQPAETSSWAFVGHSFHNPSKFGTLRFGK
ncbi:MAG TPA: sugar-binding protein, partial [Planctomycetota bacterium]|nr:sugar-binding protein [Planctomycetota bacterium]